MAVTAPAVTNGILKLYEPWVEVNASGTALEINPGDYVAWSGQYAIAVNTGITYWKTSGIGIALERNPVYDWGGRQLINTALLVGRCGTYRVSANFSGQPALGLVVAPVTTGSGVNAASAVTGVGATWNTANPGPNIPQQITYDYRDLASAISAYVAGTATGSALLAASGLFSANATSAQINGVGQLAAWYNTGPAGTGQMDIWLWDRNADTY